MAHIRAGMGEPKVEARVSSERRPPLDGLVAIEVEMTLERRGPRVEQREGE